MATQASILQFTGKLGNLIGYRRNGRYFMRSMPETVQQSPATRRAATHFGAASRKGKLIRRAFLPLLQINPDGSFGNRLNKALIQGSLPELQGLRWNKHTGISSFFSCPPERSPNGSWKIPAQILPPAGTATHLEVSLMAVRINFTERRITGRHTVSLMIDLSQPFAGAELNAHLPGNGTLILLLEVRTLQGKIASADRRYMAADILHVATATKQKKVKTPAVPNLKFCPSPMARSPRIAVLQRE